MEKENQLIVSKVIVYVNKVEDKGALTDDEVEDLFIKAIEKTIELKEQEFKKKIENSISCFLCEKKATAKCLKNHPEECKIQYNSFKQMFRED